MRLLAAIANSTIAEWATLAALFGVMYRLSRGGGGAAVQELSEANRVLTRRNHELGEEVRDLRIEVAELRTRTDFAAVIAQHEVRAQQRHVATLHVLDLIASRLGPDPNGDPLPARAA